MFQFALENLTRDVSLGLDLIAAGATLLILVKLLVSGKDIEVTVPDFKLQDLKLSERLNWLSFGFVPVEKRSLVGQSVNVRG